MKKKKEEKEKLKKKGGKMMSINIESCKGSLVIYLRNTLQYRTPILQRDTTQRIRTQHIHELKEFQLVGCGHAGTPHGF